jgi:hypothetical protein
MLQFDGIDGRSISEVALVHVIFAGPDIAAVPGCCPVLSCVADIVCVGAAAFFEPL